MSGSRNLDYGLDRGLDRDDILPRASLSFLKRRAEILAAVRDFFRSRGVLEVETPVICAAGAVDEHLDPIRVECHPGGLAGRSLSLYLVTSPEHCMKRLLAAGSGPIYQVTRAFRDGERGRLHNPEFTILEWYRPGFDHRQLMDEVGDLTLSIIPGSKKWECVTYQEAFQGVLGIDPHRASVADLSRVAERDGIPPPSDLGKDRDGWLNFLLATRIEKTLGFDKPVFLLDYPPSQAALARVRSGDPPVAERFELYVRGVELANGYHELLDPGEQERRFIEANEKRQARGKARLPLDRRFLRALELGLPSSSGVAVGFDRLVMLALGAERIDDVMAFPIERA